MRSILFLILLGFQHLNAQTHSEKFENSPASIYDGAVGNAAIHMEINNLSGQIIGWYEYPGRSTKLRLEGTMNSDGAIVLKEYNYKGAYTGQFKGNLEKDQSIFGRWNNSDNSKDIHFMVELINAVPLLKESLETNESENLSINSENKERKMFKDSKVKGFSKLALWVTILLCLTLMSIVFILLKNKKKIKKIDNELKVAKSKPTVNIITSNELSNNKELKKELADLFENYMAEKLDANNYIKITGRTADKTVNGKYLEEDTHPDIKLQFSLKDKSPIKIAIECKYSTEFKDYKVNVAKDIDQLMRYKNYSNNGEKLVFIALGVGGPPNNPNELFIIPIEVLAEPVIQRNDILIYKMDKPNLFFDPNKFKFNSFN